MKKYLLFALLIPFVFMAGCTLLGQSPEQQGAAVTKGQPSGVIIKSFRPDIPEIISGDSITFSLTVENIGEEDAEEVKAKLFGLGTDWGGEVNEDKEIGFLQKGQPQQKIPGGQGTAQWDVTSPSNLKVDNTYKAGVRVTYKYRSTLEGNLKVLSNEYLKTKPEEATQLYNSPGATFTSTKAPIEITLAGVARPFIYREAGQVGYVTIQIKNIGEGYPYVETIRDRKVTVEKIVYTTEAGAEEYCIDQTFPQTVIIPIGSYKSISCKFNLPEVSEWTTVPIKVELSYNYYVDADTSIKVLKSVV